jgi:hypothetical protein
VRRRLSNSGSASFSGSCALRRDTMLSIASCRLADELPIFASAICSLRPSPQLCSFAGQMMTLGEDEYDHGSSSEGE